ncbi:MAG: zinc-ribbon domain-containing protein, partial [Deltaproteobacteria bacterium]|nr:zinc-ribbon domain-containing protein [Deltaproteobacteria bacterium]
MNVNCPGCSNQYTLDENRIPDAGQKMRCPKCGNSFKVSKQGVVSEKGDAFRGTIPDMSPTLGNLTELDSPDLPDIPHPVNSSGGEDDWGDMFGGADLPTPSDDPFGGADLPTPSDDPFGGADLPTPSDDPFG